MTRLFSTDDSTTRLAQRLVLAAVMFPHGAQKLIGWFGGHGFSGTMAFLTGKVGLPAPVAFLVIVAESLGALALALGFLSRLTALGIAAVMIGAIALVHARVGFFMNWAGTQQGEGLEYHLLALALAIPIVVLGGGRLSVDGWLARRLAAPARPMAAPTGTPS
jgi:putative oxidoreductase